MVASLAIVVVGTCEVVVVGKALTFTPALQTSFFPESTQVYFMFEYTTTCPFVTQEELAAGWEALVALATGRSAEITLNAKSATTIRFFIATWLLRLKKTLVHKVL